MQSSTRFSKKREAIYQTLLATKTHPTAEWVYDQVREQYPDISLGTVYRNLAQLKEDGRVICVGVVNGKERFDACVQLHAHFICDRCGDIFDVDIPDYSFFDLDVMDNYGYFVRGHEFVFRGLCDKCKTGIKGE